MRMKYGLKAVLLICMVSQMAWAQTPVSINGKLKLVGLQLSSECGNPVQLKGMSTHGLQWFPQCIYNASNTRALDSLSLNWGADIIRLANYVEEGGYLTDTTRYKTMIDSLVDRIGRKGMYCLIDWHIVQHGTDSAGDPHRKMGDAKRFWDYMSKKHGGKKHVLYEICNEPSGNWVDWPRIKSYADTIIHVIRKNDPESIIIVGTPQWSGNPAAVVGNELPDSISYNVMYTYHFYATTHKGYIPQIKNIVTKIPIFVSEWGTTTSSGTGQIDFVDTDRFMDVFNGNNAAGVTVSWCNWSLADNTDSSSVLKSNSCASYKFSNTSKSGTKVRSMMNVPDKFAACSDAPIIFQDPRSSTVIEGDSTGFLVVARGTDLSYIWQKSGDGLQWDSIPNSDSSLYIVDSATVLDTLYYRVVVSNVWDTLWSNPAKLSVLVKGPFNGVPLPIPGIIQAEQYDIGKSGVAYLDKTVGNSGGAFRNDDVDVEPCADEGGGYDIGYIDNGEYLIYTVSVQDTGYYTFTFRVANNSKTANGRLLMSVNGQIIVPGTAITYTGGYQSWVDVIVPSVYLYEGVQKFRLSLGTGGFNINYIKVDNGYAVGISIQELASSMSLFPNPTNETLYLTSSKYEITGTPIEILNSIGMKVGEVMAQSKNVEMNVQGLPAGMYLLHFPLAGENVYLKWIKN
jgi:hypothetical protein